MRKIKTDKMTMRTGNIMSTAKLACITYSRLIIGSIDVLQEKSIGGLSWDAFHRRENKAVFVSIDIAVKRRGCRY